MNIKTIETKNCGVCSNGTLREIWDLPNFPLTEMYGQFDSRFPKINQKLLLCNECGHVQLGVQVDPKFLYQESEYSFRTVISPKIDAELKLLQEFIKFSVPGMENRKVLELGSSNFELASRISKSVSEYAVCDPLLKDLNGQVIDGIKVHGMLAEDLLQQNSFSDYDLIFGRHVLEHIGSPHNFLMKLLDCSPVGAIFLFEVPSLNHIRAAGRFDAVYHQHFQYFDSDSVINLLKNLDCNLIGLQYNPLGSNGGSMLFSFQKGMGKYPDNHKPSESLSFKFDKMLQEIDLFRVEMNILGKRVLEFDGEIAGYGAAHMLATLDYHLNGAIGSLKFIIDDNEELHGSSYRNIDVGIVSNGKVHWDKLDAVLITSMENRRAMVSNLIRLRDVKIITTNIL
jgi:hypothetical protein